MKTKLLGLVIAYFAIRGLVAVSNVWIEWRFHDKLVHSIAVNGETVEFGLRQDGVVVWRKITNTTNSPAEQVVFNYVATNYLVVPCFTNYWKNIWTTNLLISP
jgi:hypothetical protein